MNPIERKNFEIFVKKFKFKMMQLDLKIGPNRSSDHKKANYNQIMHYLQGIMKKPPKSNDVSDAKIIIEKVLEKKVEVEEPQKKAIVKNYLPELERSSTGVRIDHKGISVRLEIDQSKHQHKLVPIGCRQTKGGNKFLPKCDGAWHKKNTLVHMGKWADGLKGLSEGDKEEHGQFKPVGGIHYEGYCRMIKGKKYVLFHCYPSNKSELLYVKVRGSKY